MTVLENIVLELFMIPDTTIAAGNSGYFRKEFNRELQSYFLDYEYSVAIRINEYASTIDHPADREILLTNERIDNLTIHDKEGDPVLLPDVEMNKVKTALIESIQVI